MSIKQYKIKIILITLIIISCSFGAYLSTPSYSYKPWVPKIDPNVAYKVVKVLDGDTFEIKVGKQNVKVRMLGIDTPETVDPRKIVQCFGKQASDMTKKLLMKHAVTLEADATQGITDKWNRVLAYVTRDDGMFVNQYLLTEGYAHEYTYGVQYEKQKEFKEYEKTAREGKMGLWGGMCGEGK